MKVIADEMIASNIVKVINLVALNENILLQSVQGSEFQGQQDMDWIQAFANAGGKGILSADRKMLRKKTFIQEILKLGVTFIYLPHNWATSRINEQAAYLLFHWPQIQDTFKTKSKKSRIWLTPKGFAKSEFNDFQLKKKN